MGATELIQACATGGEFGGNMLQFGKNKCQSWASGPVVIRIRAFADGNVDHRRRPSSFDVRDGSLAQRQRPFGSERVRQSDSAQEQLSSTF